MPELRKDPIIGRWVIVSTERARRPDQFSGNLNRLTADSLALSVKEMSRRPRRKYIL